MQEAPCEEVPPSSQDQSELSLSGSQGRLGPWTPRVTCHPALMSSGTQGRPSASTPGGICIHTGTL